MGKLEGLEHRRQVADIEGRDAGEVNESLADGGTRNAEFVLEPGLVEDRARREVESENGLADLVADPLAARSSRMNW